MNRFFYPIPIVGVAAAITLSSQSVLALESSEIAAKAKEFIVQIDGEESGTGTIIEHQGNTYTVIYNEAIRLNPQYATAYNNRGNSYSDLGEDQKAIADFQQAANLFQQQGNTELYQKVLNIIKELQ